MYEIIMTHNRPWSVMELVIFFILLSFVTTVVVWLVRKGKIVYSQAAAAELLFVFLMVVLASTVFTRTSNGEYSYQLALFWSWREAALGDKGILEEILLNIVLLMPAGCLFPFVFHRKIPAVRALLTGALFSLFIEVCQLIFCRGLFEWDDMLHNSLGAMLGCMLSNKVFGKLLCSRKV